MKRLLTFCYTLLYYAATLHAQGDDVRIVHFSEADGYNQTVVASAVQDRQGYVWLGTWGGLCRYDGYRFKNYKMRPGDGSPLRTNRIGTVSERADGDIECTSTDSLFFVFHRQAERFALAKGNYDQRPRPYRADSSTVERVRRLPQFAGAYANIVLVDRQGGIWVDTHSGLYRVWFTKKALVPTKFSAANEEVVRGLYADRQGRIWVADKNGYVRLFDGRRSLLGFLTPDGRLSATPVAFGLRVYCFYQDSRGDMWLGSKPGGLTRLRPQADGTYSVRRYVHAADDIYSLSCDNVYAITEDDSQRLWIATYRGGLNMLDLNGKREVFVHNGNGLTGWPADDASSKMFCLYIAPGQVLVAGTLGGLYTSRLSRQPQRMHFYRNNRRPADALSLPYDWVMDIQPIGSDTLAIATSGGGLSFIGTHHLLSDNIRFRTYTTADGLSSDICQSLYSDGQGGLYIVSRTSISRLSLGDGTFTNYLRGTLGEHFNFLEEKPVRSADGHMLFGTTQGLLDIAPTDMLKSSYQPAIVFDCPDTLWLSAHQRSLTIQFAALDFNKSVPITYAYRISGMTDQWTYITDPQLTLPDIPAGTWSLHLRSTNGDGVWTAGERVLVIHRRAAFNETPYAWMLYGLLLTLLVIGVALTIYYVRRMQREIKDIRLTSQQRIGVMSERIQELLSIREAVERIDASTEAIANDDDRQFAEHIKSYVADHLADPGLSILDIAREMAVSRTVLFARMKSVFGTSPGNYLLNQRAQQACRLLRQPGAYVADVAYRCGFSDPKYFSKCFKKLMGQTPTEYQKSTTV
ncbi:MAG: helix-turn-helix domain-containing protein [Prevotella sp.]|nr:helix-turn-helix domain-containing protein [Prevotella sp.]